MEKKLEDELQQLRLMVDAGAAEDALEKLRKLRERPAFPAEELWQLDELAGACYSMLCDMERAAGCYWQASTHDKYLRSQMGHYSSYLFCLHYLSDISAQEMKQAHFFYDRLFADIRRYEHPQGGYGQKKKLRIGYLSTDFHDHAMADFIRPLLSLRDTSRYEAFCYAMQDTSDAVTQEFRGLADGWRDLSGKSFADAAQSVFEDGVDILFDLSGHTHGGCTLITAAYKPAPVQISGIGWFDTTGLSAMDYFLTDTYFEDRQENFCERLLALSKTHMCYMPQQHSLPSYGRRTAGAAFGCFNNFAKITDEMLVVWYGIVQRVPGSRLLLKNTEQHPHEEAVLLRRALQTGFTREQLEIRTATDTYLQEYGEVDIALDTYPYPGGGTTCEALYMGVPVISLYGTRHGSRFGYSILQNIGLGELAVTCIEEYIQTAVALAMDRELLLFLHQHLRSMMQKSPLMDAKNYVAEVESCYAEIWEKYLQG